MKPTTLYRCSALAANLTVKGCEDNRARAGKKSRHRKVRDLDLDCCLTCPGIVARSRREGVPPNVIDPAMLVPPGRIAKGHDETGATRAHQGRVSKRLHRSHTKEKP